MNYSEQIIKCDELLKAAEGKSISVDDFLEIDKLAKFHQIHINPEPVGKPVTIAIKRTYNAEKVDDEMHPYRLVPTSENQTVSFRIDDRVEFLVKTNKTINKYAEVCYCAAGAWLDEGAELWGLLSEREQESTIREVIFILDSPDASPAMQHDFWLHLAEGFGWEFGTELSTHNKTHPDMLPFSDISEALQRKYTMYSNIVKALETNIINK